MTARASRVLLAACCGAALPIAALGAASIEVSPGDCRRDVHLVARDAPLSAVLDRLAAAQGFRVATSEPISTPVTIDAVQPTRRLLATLLGEANTIVKEEADPTCPGRFRVAMVWVVGRRSPEPRPVGAAPPPPQKQAPYVTPEAKEQDDLYRRAHGMLPE